MPKMDVRIDQEPTTASAIPPGDNNQSIWFAEEVLPHEPALRAWLRSRFPALSDDDDIVQESYIRLIRTQGLNKVANAKSYLFTVARNLTLDLFRRNRAAPIVTSSDYERASVAGEQIGVAESVCNSQEFEILEQAIEALPERCRVIMTMQKLHGLSNLEIAERLGLSVNTVNAQLVIGLARCRRYLLARGVLRGRRS